ncbi:MAG TPA: penicillin-binding transpeptidase domain-containing protein [Actinomycetota bacterium]|nr:penicillin-binding transpeptidase domain-containing protein [Actinomycetota bacterium]
MDRLIRRLGAAMLALFVLLLVQVTYIQVVASERLADNPANATRQLIAEYRVDRGSILAADGTTELALSRRSPGQLKYQRHYPQGPLYADITGYYSIIFGRSELEQSYNTYLSGDAPELIPQTLIDQVLGRPKRGATVVTTIDPAIQRAAARALGDLPGGVVALDPHTGDVKAIVANPTYDPNELASQDPKKVRAAWDRLNSDPDKPLLSRAIDELYPPGSTFKLVTAAAALEDGFGPDSTWPNPPVLDLPQTTATLENFGGEHCLGGASQITLAQALTISCNVVFGEIGLRLGGAKLADQAHAFGLAPDASSGDVPFDIPFQEGVFPEASYFSDRLPAVALSAIGQDNVAANPMQMALVASAIANGGSEMRPRLVSEIRDPSGQVIESFAPEVFGQPISSQTAIQLTQMMVSVVQSGTGTAAQIPGIEVAGKTGTAQHGEGLAPHAWFVSFAPAQNARIAVAVIVLDGGSLGSDATGGVLAAPIAKAVMEAALNE